VALISLRYEEKTNKLMNILSILLCFVLAYGVFALIAFKIVKVMFPDTERSEKPWRVGENT
jgi:hypothetical protein